MCKRKKQKVKEGRFKNTSMGAKMYMEGNIWAVLFINQEQR